MRTDSRQPPTPLSPPADAGRAAVPSPRPTVPPKRNIPYLAAHAFTSTLTKCGLRHAARGVDRVPSGGGLLVANHASNLDPLMVGVRLPRPVCFLAKDSLFRVPLLGPFLRATHTIPVDRSAAGASSIRAIVEKVSAGYLAAVFPEGTRTKDGSVGTFKPGFLSIVRKAGCPVIPVGIAGTFEVWSASMKVPRPGRVRVVYGEPVAAGDLPRDRSEAVAAVRERVVAAAAEAAEWRSA